MDKEGNRLSWAFNYFLQSFEECKKKDKRMNHMNFIYWKYNTYGGLELVFLLV